MNKREEVVNNEQIQRYKGNFQLPLIIGVYLTLDIILLFLLCIIEFYFKIDHQIILIISFVLEFLAVLYVALKGNIKSSIILYILLVVSPVFLGLIAMAMNYFMHGAIPFTPTILYIFRTGYNFDFEKLNIFLRIITIFRIPALCSIIVSSLIRLKKKDK